MKMMKYIKYAISKYLFWLGIFATIIGIVAIVPIDKCVAIIIILACIFFAFVIPFLESILKRKFKLKTIGKSDISLEFGNLFDEECFVVTTNRYFDVNPTGDYIAEGSLLGCFVKCFFSDNVLELERLIRKELVKSHSEPDVKKYDYGTWIKIKVNEKIVYLLAFTDRNKSDQPDDFYQTSIKKFLTTIVNENHGKTIAVPLFGDNNNLSDSGFSNSEISFRSLMAMINDFEISNQRSELKLKIVTLPKKRTEIINVVNLYSK